ncbi:Uncharacterised protein [uncultured Leptotrichia sp.]|uniref:hypothetical protein n=1 Tax=uncultured Leptotrichia sp. TaxID=159271 RepID=UPI001A3B36F2|nr:hypothetical protein [uncultured Leptotrichia sp.]VTX49171.1 Uncharacterised protein [uncultured Leptotrichia sp.]
MKKILFTLALFFIINLNLAALTMKEKIQQDLSKAGVKQEIIDETVKLDKKFGEGFVEEDGDGKRATESKDEWEKLYQKDKRNYVALERLIESYFVTGIPNDSQKKKYVSEYLKMNIPEDRKNFVLGMDFWNCSENKNIKNEYFEKVKKTSNNQYYLKGIDLFEYISKETENIKEDGNPKLMKQKIDEITQKMDEIDKILDNKNLLEKYRISDEEAYSNQLTFFMVGGILKAVTGDTEGMVNDFINKIANKKISKEVAEYNQNKEIITALLIKLTLVFKELFGDAPKEGKNFEKLIKRLDETEMYKRIIENTEKGETIENDSYLEEERKNFESLSDDDQIKQIVNQKKFDYIETRIDKEKKIFDWTFGCDGLNCKLVFLGKNKDFEKKIKLKDLKEKEKIVRILIFGKREEDEEISEGVFLRKGTDSKDNKFYVYDDENEDKILTVFAGQNENLDFFKFVNEILGEDYRNIEAKYGGRD